MRGHGVMHHYRLWLPQFAQPAFGGETPGGSLSVQLCWSIRNPASGLKANSVLASVDSNRRAAVFSLLALPIAVHTT